jgi:hypothetical protein
MDLLRHLLLAACCFGAAGTTTPPACCSENALTAAEDAATPGACFAAAASPAAPHDNAHDTTLFLRLYAGSEAETNNQLFPSLALFWPGARVLAVLDGESDADHRYAPRLLDACAAAGAACNVTFSDGAETIPAAGGGGAPTAMEGHDRQQWTMLHVDSYLPGSALVGFLDSDTVFNTPVTRPGLYVKRTPTLLLLLLLCAPAGYHQRCATRRRLYSILFYPLTYHHLLRF